MKMKAWMRPIMAPSSRNGIGNSSPAMTETIAITSSWLITLPKSRTISEKVRVISDRTLSGSSRGLGST